jgi:hypothetical protein
MPLKASWTGSDRDKDDDGGDSNHGEDCDGNNNIHTNSANNG